MQQAARQKAEESEALASHLQSAQQCVRELELSVSDVFTQQTGTIRSCPESEMP
jgi:hypothetical protein